MNHRLARSWSSLHGLAIIIVAENLNTLDHASLRSVCKQWRCSTEARQKAPFVILKEDSEEGTETVRSLSFFDIIHQIIIPLRPLASQRVVDSYYLGSSRGWIFVGTYTAAQNDNQEELWITLLNPFTDDSINLPMLSNHPRGRVFLLNSPRNLQRNHELTVVYYNHIGQPRAEVNYIILGQQNEWERFRLPRRPDNVIASENQIFASYNGVLHMIDLHTRNILGAPMTLMLFLQRGSISLPLRFYQNTNGGLHVVFFSGNGTYCIAKVAPSAGNPSEFLSLFAPHDILPASPRRQLVTEDLVVEDIFSHDYVHVASYDPSGLFASLSAVWGNDWEALGWITPTLL